MTTDTAAVRVPWWAILAGVSAVLAAAVLFVFHGAYDLYFAQDDFRGLAAAAGIHPPHADLWRYVSVRSFMDVLHPWFGTDPRPYHVVSFLLHAGNAVLLFVLLAKRLHPAAAAIGALFFATHPAHFTALYWLSARADLMAASFGLVTLALATLSRADRWLAVPVFALALLSKESMLLLPVAVLAARAWPERTGETPRPLWDAPVAVMVLMSTTFLIYLALPRETGIRFETGTDAAYNLTFGWPLLQNLLTYSGWSVDLAMVKPGVRFVDARNPDLFALGAIALAIAGFGCAFDALRRRGWMVGCVAFLVFLAPVLPLENHTYRYYLYAPLLAAGLCVAVLVDLGIAALSHGAATWRPRLAWSLAAVLAVALTWNGARLVTQMETRPSRVYPGMFGDPIVDRAHIARNVIRSLEVADLPPQAELGFVMRERLALIARIERGSGEAPAPDVPLYPETNVQAAILDGLAIGALIPGVAAVSFEPPTAPPGPAYRYVVYAPTGECEVYTPEELDTLLESDWIRRW